MALISVQEAEQIILAAAQPLSASRDREMLPLSQALGRILAQPVTSQLDFPHWDNSAMDGYAVRYADVQSCRADQPVCLEIVEEIAAGCQPQYPLEPGQAARILTGAVMPAGADTVVMQEDTQRAGDRVWICTAPRPQAFVRHRAAYYQAGETLLPAGMRLGGPELAVLAAAQSQHILVYRQPRVALLSTGSELVDIDQPLQAGQIVDSNQYALTALVAAEGAVPQGMGRVADDPVALSRAISGAVATADVVLSSGGVSVGDYDYVEQVLTDLGAKLELRSVAIKPGKPLTFATLERQQASPVLYFGLPGNPASALVTFWRFVLPALRKISGLSTGWNLPIIQAQTRQPLRSDRQRATYLWGRLHLSQGQYEFELAGGSHSSGNLINLAGTNALAVLPVGEFQFAAGDWLPVMQVR